MKNVTDRIAELRRNIAVHSYLYYRMYESVVPDAVFDMWCRELVKLQTEHPEESEEVPYHLDYFRDWEGASGLDFPFTDEIKMEATKLLS